jgi:hypothetical protein
MAVKNPKKQFNFRISIPKDPSLPIFSCQEVKLPDFEIDEDEHGEGNLTIKTAGMVKISKATLSRIMPSSPAQINASLLSKYFFDWAGLAQNILIGGGSDEGAYKRDVLIYELANDGITVLNTSVLTGAWVSKINGRAYKRAESGNLVEEVELSVDYLTHL